MTTIVGVDISTKRIDVAILAPRAAPVFGTYELDPDHTYLDAAFAGAKMLAHEADIVVIEAPYGPNRKTQTALDYVIGAFRSRIPANAAVQFLSASQWRAALGAKNTKADGHRAVRELMRDDSIGIDQVAGRDEHELDALGVALAWRKLTERQA